MDTNLVAESATEGMGTVIMHKVFGVGAGDALRVAQGETARLEGMLSRFIEDSEIARINRSAGIAPEKVSGDTYAVLSRAVEFSRRSAGRFDVTVGPLVKVWNVYGGVSSPPEDKRIAEAKALVDYTDIGLDSRAKTVMLRRVGQFIDLGGIGKGFAADVVLERLREYGIDSAFTNFGGNVAALGTKPDGSPWRVGIRHPRQEGGLVGAVSAANRSVVTSGDYMRYFMDGSGRRYHHILDPRTGYPADSGLASVTVLAQSSLDADALSTILFVAGMDEGLAILRQFPRAEAIFIDHSGLVSITGGLGESFEPAAGVTLKRI